MEEEHFQFEKQELVCSANMKEADHNITMLRHRAKAKNLNNNITEEELNALFPLMK